MSANAGKSTRGRNSYPNKMNDIKKAYEQAQIKKAFLFFNELFIKLLNSIEITTIPTLIIFNKPLNEHESIDEWNNIGLDYYSRSFSHSVMSSQILRNAGRIKKLVDPGLFGKNLVQSEVSDEIKDKIRNFIENKEIIKKNLSSVESHKLELFFDVLIILYVYYSKYIKPDIITKRLDSELYKELYKFLYMNIYGFKAYNKDIIDFIKETARGYGTSFGGSRKHRRSKSRKGYSRSRRSRN